MKKVLSAFSEVVNTERRWTPDWYSWLSELQDQVNQGLSDLQDQINQIEGQPQFVFLDQFGAVGDGVADDTPSLLAAFAQLPRGGVIVLSPKKYLFDVGYTVPRDVYLVGQTLAPGYLPPPAFDNYGTVIFHNSAQTYTYGSGSGLLNSIVLRKGLVLPTTPAQADALIAAMAGTAIVLEGDDIVMERLMIGGFNLAIDWGTFADRYRISYIVFDCLNGIRIGRIGDVGHINFIKSFPFLTGENNVLDGGPNQLRMHRRNGVALEFKANPAGNSDYVYVSHTNFFGWTTGILVGDGNNNVLLDDCTTDWDTSDNATNPTTAIGVRVVAPTNVTVLTIDRFRCSGMHSGIQLEGNGTFDLKISNGIFFNNHRDIYAPSGCVATGVVIGCEFDGLISSGGAVVSIELQDDVGPWTVVGCLFNGPYPGNVFNIHDGAAANGFAQVGNTFQSCVNNMAAVEVARLPTAANSAGTRTFVNDAVSLTYGDVVAGGGTSFGPVWCDGVDWRNG